MSTLQLRKYLRWVAVVLWMGMLFYLSHQPGEQSSELSSGITASLIDFMQSALPFVSLDADTVHHLIRKSAHFSAYAVLGALVIHALRLPNGKRAALAFLICVVYASTDETHQLFIPGRSGEVRDVLLDSAGAATGLGIYLLLAGLYRKKRRVRRKI